MALTWKPYSNDGQGVDSARTPTGYRLRCRRCKISTDGAMEDPKHAPECPDYRPPNGTRALSERIRRATGTKKAQWRTGERP